MDEAGWWEACGGDAVRCLLCPHGCVIRSGNRGLCGVRENRGGVLRSLNRGLVSALSADPVEKKPLRRYLPGTRTLSAGSFGCNLWCPWCQNAGISREIPPTRPLSPRELTALARREGCPSVAFTYNEPTVFYEWTLDAARTAKAAGLGVILVTNGYMNPGPLSELLPFVDAMNIDLKTFDADLHRKHTGGELRHVLATLETVARSRCHLEVTTLLVPGVSDDPDTLEAECRWLAELSPGIPLHLTRYFPRWRFREPPTAPETLSRSAQIARRHLRDVLIGNA